MKQIDRRKVLLFGLLGSSSLVSGCFWHGDDVTVTAATGQPPSPSPSPAPTPTPTPTPTPPPAPAASWSVSPTPYFLTNTGSVFDLSVTLPVGVRKGGTFGVASNGSPLPAGMTLSPSGLLSVGSATPGRADGVIFTYAEPA